MPTVTVTYAGRRLPIAAGDSVLHTLLDAGIEIPNACQSGVCGACTLRCESGELPEAAQVGLREVEREQGLFLACQCRPTTDLSVRSLGEDDEIEAEVVEHTWLSDSVARLRLVPVEALAYEAGQYLALVRDDGLVRSYSLASLPSDPWLELHVRRIPGGRMSTWLGEDAAPGTRVGLRRARGTCCYPSGELDAPLLLVGVGTGLAPIWGVLRQALANGHRGRIVVVQAGASAASLYLGDELRELAQAHDQVEVRTCVRDGAATDGPEIEVANVTAVAGQVLGQAADPSAWLCYVCGDPDVVKALRLELFLAGVASRRILADAFILGPDRSTSEAAE